MTCYDGNYPVLKKVDFLNKGEVKRLPRDKTSPAFKCDPFVDYTQFIDDKLKKHIEKIKET